MTNAQIIFNESLKLMEEGILTGCGRMVEIEAEDGTTKLVEAPEAIHTFAAWKAAGYSVKRGEHAVAKFVIWKYASSKNASDEDSEASEESGKCFMKLSHFFKASQVEKIA